MEIDRKSRWLWVGIIISCVVLISTACIPLSKDSKNPIEGTISIQGTGISQLATQLTGQKQIEATQQELISELSTQMSSGFERITETPTPLPLHEIPTSFPVCTPPACEPDEMFHCPGDCPGGCGTTCATVTPGISSGSGQVFGEICYPGETIPGMMIYFQEINTQRILDFSVAENQNSYQLEITPGVYVAFAWLPNNEMGGGYTQYVRCKKTILSCTDHSLVPFLVRENHVTIDVDICDWDGDTSLFPAVPAE